MQAINLDRRQEIFCSTQKLWYQRDGKKSNMLYLKHFHSVRTIIPTGNDGTQFKTERFLMVVKFSCYYQPLCRIRFREFF